MEVLRTFDLLDLYEQKFDKEIAISAKKSGKWINYSSKEFIEISHNVAYGLLELGLKKGDKIITVTNNRPEWNFIDHGMSMCGIVHVPVYTSLSKDEYSFIIKHSEAKMAFVSDKKTYDLLLPGCKKTLIEKHLYSFDPIEKVPSFSSVAELGSKNKDKWSEKLKEIKAGISEKDMASLLYTSGTTGTPKGVMLSHENLCKNFIAAASVFKLQEKDKYLSILPLCHVGGRMGNYQTQYSGTGIYYAESMGTFVKALKEIGANGFDAVPRVMEKIYDTVIAKGNELSGMKKKIFFWAVKLGFKYDIHDNNTWWYRKRLAFADKTIFAKWREALGGEVRLVGCGGASLQSRLERLFWASGIKIINMYGLTETSPIITISRQEKGNIRLGSVGTLIDGVELKIANDGEILCKGHNVMLGYYKDEKLSSEVFDEEGWFHTGDIGHLEEGKFLAVTDRKKEIFKLSNGKFIAPQHIEGIFKQSAFIEHMMVVGEHQKFASAIIVPDFEQLGKWAEGSKINYTNNEELICLAEIQKQMQKEINNINRGLSDHERLLRFRLVKDIWSPESGELSATLKLKRKVVTEKYSTLLNSIYN